MEAFRVSKTLRQKLKKRNNKIAKRLRNRAKQQQENPQLSASNIHYDMAERTQGFAYGGIGAIHQLAKQSGLVQDLNDGLALLKRHLPYFESDHVLNIAYNILCNGQCIEDIERLRNDEVYLNALGAETIPDPTTAGDFCRRFTEQDVQALMNIINDVRVRIWQKQPDAFFEQAIIDADGTIAPTYGECKEGMDISYKGIWGYHPLLISLANTGEALYLVNRSGNAGSSVGAAGYFDRAIELCLLAGFRNILLRGDTDFSQTEHLDRWDGRGAKFVFGIDAMPNLKAIAEGLSESDWKPFIRPAKYDVRTKPRKRPKNIKEPIVVEREFKNIRLHSEQVAEFSYRPTKCKKSYRMVVIRKNLSIEKGENVLFDEIRYFFYITNLRTCPASEIVRHANRRCNQENIIEQLKNGVHSMRMPVDNLVSNWAYMVMASLAWTLKVWFALSLPESGRWSTKHKTEKQAVLKMEFKKFRQNFIHISCQIIRGGHRILYRLLSWNPWLDVFFRGLNALSIPLRC